MDFDPDSPADTELIELVVQGRGEVREALAWLRARPEWISVLEEHQALISADELYGPALGGLLLLVRDDPAVPNLDELPTAVVQALREDAEAEQRFQEDWRAEIRRSSQTEWGSPGDWIVTVAGELWTDPRTREHFADLPEVAAYLLSTISLSWTAFVVPGPGPAGGLEGMHPAAVEALISSTTSSFSFGQTASGWKSWRGMRRFSRRAI